MYENTKYKYEERNNACYETFYSIRYSPVLYFSVLRDSRKKGILKLHVCFEQEDSNLESDFQI